nr:hypothetical protein [Tanacetum cinerariifolium]
MTSFDYRLNPLYPIKECSSYGALYTTDYCCSDGSLRDRITCNLNKTPDLFQEPPQYCPKCGNPIDGQYCQGCALLRKKFKEDMFTYCIENGIFQDFQDTSEPSNDNTNVVNALQEPFVVKQDPCENSSQSPPHINHHCCYECGNSLEDIFCHQCTCEFCGKGAHYGYNCPPKVSVVSNSEPCHNQNVDELSQILTSFHPSCYSGDEDSFVLDSTSNIVHDSSNELAMYINTLSWDRPTICYNDDDDEDYTIAITPILSTNEPDNSLSMGDEHLDTISATESDELIKSSVENLVSIPSESEGIPDNMYILLTIKDDILHEKLLNINPLIANIEALKDNPTLYSDFMTKSSSTSFNFLLVVAVPLLVLIFLFHIMKLSMTIMLKRLVVAVPLLILIFLFMIRSSLIFRSIHFLLPIGVTFIMKSSPMTSLTSYLHHSMIVFALRMNLNSGDFTMDVVEDTFPTRELRVHVHNVLPTHPTLQLNLDFIPSSESLFAYVVWIFLPFLSYSVSPQYLLSFGNEDTIFDLGISICHSFMPDVSHWNLLLPFIDDVDDFIQLLLILFLIIVVKVVTE